MELTDLELYEDLCRTLDVLFREEIELSHFHIGEITADLFRLGMIKDENDHWAHEVLWYNYPDITYKPDNFDELHLSGEYDEELEQKIQIPKIPILKNNNNINNL